MTWYDGGRGRRGEAAASADCHVTYQATIEEAGARRNTPREAVFDIYQEARDPLLGALFSGLT